MNILKRQNMILAIAGLSGLAAVVKFLLDGVTLTYAGHTLDFGHMDSMSYMTLLAPTLGAHSYLELKNKVKGDAGVDKS